MEQNAKIMTCLRNTEINDKEVENGEEGLLEDKEKQK
jgi:hypothetical protein